MFVKNRNPERISFLLIILIFTFTASAQTHFGDEWIKTKQTYLRIPVVKTGFYTITSQELKSAGLAVDEIPAASFQMFRRGKELAIEVQSEASGILGIDGNISFYGEKNDGARDSLLYVNPAAMPHSHYSLYSDTAAYFLTYNLDGLSGKRIGKVPFTKTEKILSYHFEEVSEIFNSNYFVGNFYPTGSNFDNGSVLSNYDIGEGWTGKELSNAWQTVDVNVINPDYENFGKSEVELVIVGRSAGEHEIEIWSGTQSNLGKKITTLHLLDYESITYKFLLRKEDVGMASKISVSIYSKAKTGSVSLSFVRWRYPQKTFLSGSFTQKEFYFEKDSVNRIWDIGKASDWQFYDCSDSYNLKKPEQNGSQISISGTTKIIGWREVLKVSSIRLLKFTSIDTLQTDYLIISHPLVRKAINGVDPVAAYASYRSSVEGGSYKPLIINSEEIYDRFNYGEPGPLGIKNLIARMHRQGKLKFVFIIGRSTDPQTARKLGNAREIDMIPNAGWPGSDLALSMGIGGSPDFAPLVPVGRINAANSENVWTYLQKVKAMEAEPAAAPWRKNILHLSGGRSKDELLAFRAYVKSFENIISNTSLGAHVETISKQTDAEVEQFPIHIPVNKGVALMTLYGHSGLDVTDIDIGYASDKNREYANRPFYPAVIVNGCALGSVFYSAKTISTDWIFSPENGAVLFLAHTFNGVSSSLKHYTDSFYQVLADSMFNSEPFGIIQKEAIRRNMKLYPTLSDGITAQQMNLHGDPAIRIFPARLPDYTFDPTLLTFKDLSGNKLSVWSDSIKVQVGIINNGRFRKENYQLLMKIKSDSSTQILIQSSHQSVASADTLHFTIANPFKRSEECSWEIVIDPENKLPEESKSNNTIKRQFLMPEGGAFPLVPLPDYITDEQEIELIAQIPGENNNQEVVFEWDTNAAFSSPVKIIVLPENAIASCKISVPEIKKQDIFWRVYCVEDQRRPSGFRKIIYNPDTLISRKLPEGVAFAPASYPAEIQEGETFSAIATFQNVTDQAFSDSLTVIIMHEKLGKSEKSLLKISPLKAKEKRELQISSASVSEPGIHQIFVSFNSENLPEEIYSNNDVYFSCKVIPDILPPVLTVNVDNRPLADGDFVASQPVIGIQVLDENKFLVRNDTSGIEVFIREECTGCKEQRVFLKNALVSYFLPNDLRVKFKLDTPLKNGSYRLRVRASDFSGNPANEYRIHFKVQDFAKTIRAGVSPNPSRQWFRFYFEVHGFLPENRLEIIVHDLKGREVKRMPVLVKTGMNEWFWQPENLPAGIYFYRMQINQDKSTLFSDVKGLKGKLIWVK